MLVFYILSIIIMKFLIMIFSCTDLMHPSPFPSLIRKKWTSGVDSADIILVSALVSNFQ